MAGLKLCVVADNPAELIFLPPPPKSCDFASLSRFCFCCWWWLFSILIGLLFYVYKSFACMYVFVLLEYLVPTEAKEVYQIPQNCSYRYL